MIKPRFTSERTLDSVFLWDNGAFWIDFDSKVLKTRWCGHLEGKKKKKDFWAAALIDNLLLLFYLFDWQVKAKEENTVLSVDKGFFLHYSVFWTECLQNIGLSERFCVTKSASGGKSTEHFSGFPVQSISERYLIMIHGEKKRNKFTFTYWLLRVQAQNLCQPS